MLSIWKFFLDNRAFAYFVMALVVVAGSYALMVIPKESAPEIDLPIAVVNTSYFGASASDVEILVTDPLEKQIDGVQGIDEYTSVSRSGISSITVSFNQGEDIDERVDALKDAIDQAIPDLPADGNDPRVSKIDFSSQPILSVSLVSSLPLFSFEQIVDEVVEKIEAINGVAQVMVDGIPDKEVSVLIDNRRLAQYKLDYNSIINILSNSSISVPGGSLEIANIPYPIEVASRVLSEEEIPRIPLAYSGDSLVTVSDVARVQTGFVPRDTFTRVGLGKGEIKQAVTINVSKTSGGDITRITDEINTTLASLEKSTLQGIDTVVTFDMGESIKRDLGNLSKSGLQTMLLVLAVLMIFVGLRESFIAALSIPLSFMLAFVAFLMVGNTINFISLFALILSIGILVDSAIVVVEGINTKVAEGMRRQEAALATVREFGLPLLAGTMTTVAVFFPLLFLSGIVGQFIRSIPFTVILVLLSAMVVSLGFVTVLCASFLKNRDYVQSHTTPWATRFFERLNAYYRRLLHTLLHHTHIRRIFQVGITLVAFSSLALVGFGLVKTEFFPSGDIEFAYIAIELESGTTLDQTSEAVSKVEQKLQEYDYLESFVTTIGKTSVYSENVEVGEQYANIILNIKSELVSEGEMLLSDLRRVLEGADFEYAELISGGGGPPTGSAIDITLNSEDTAILAPDARRIAQALREVPGVYNVNTTLPGNTAGFAIIVDRSAASRFGISIFQIAQAIQGATEGIEVFTITRSNEDVRVMVKNSLAFDELTDTQTNRITPDKLRALSVKNPQGVAISLGSMIDIELQEANTVIRHQDGNRFVGITADIEAGFNKEELRKEFNHNLDDLVSDGVVYSFGGEQAEQNESFQEIFVALIAGLFLMFAILILQFGRWRQVLIVMSVLFYALAGVLIGLFISGNSLSFPAMLGTIALFGIVVNNSLILVSVFNELRITHPDWTISEVVIEGSVMRLRPILLTTLTTIIGVSPLLYASAIWAPIAYAIIFGLFFCVFITLAMIPLLYRRFEGFAYGSWKSVWSWIIHTAIILILPTGALIGVAVLANQSSISTAFGLYAGLVLALAMTYIITKSRKE
ncbi:MAG: efflux RND transporter permease subunit [Patescibacteria group bacterium]